VTVADKGFSICADWLLWSCFDSGLNHDQLVKAYQSDATNSKGIVVESARKHENIVYLGERGVDMAWDDEDEVSIAESR
jgi:hypothetical protein